MTDPKTFPKDPEVIQVQAPRSGRKRRFTAEEKQRLLREAEARAKRFPRLLDVTA